MGQVTEKQCSKCGEVKPINMFYRKKNASDGLRGECKECEKVRRIAWLKDNPEKTKHYNATKYAKCNRQDRLKQVKSWAADNPEKLKLYGHRYRLKTKEESASKQRKQREKLSDSYVRAKLKLTVDVCPPELIELKRIHLQITRELRSKK